MPLPIHDINTPTDRQSVVSLIQRLKATAGGNPEIADTVSSIIEDVRKRGDDAVVHYMKQWTNPHFKSEDICVTQDQIQAATESLPADLKNAMIRAIEHVRAYETHIKPKDSEPILIDGAELQVRFTPINRIGLHVPGGRAAYPSTAIMLTVPAQVAGCSETAMVSPPPTVRPGESAEGLDISPYVLGACGLVGQKEIYRVGGAQGVAALALGTESIAPVDHIVGPGNAFTQEAKRQVFGAVGIDGFFGPSEAVVLADESCKPAWVAADLIAQAEHDPGCCFLMSTSQSVLEAVLSEIEKQLPLRQRRAPIEQALNDWSCAMLMPDEQTIIEWMDIIAGEHVTLAVEDPKSWLEKLNNGGAWFLGHGSAIAAGDYYAGPNHSLPTGTTARFNSGLSVYGFMKRSSVEYYPQGRPPQQAINDIATFAQAEGLDAHAHSLRVRGE